MKRTYLFRFNCTLNISMVRNKERFISVSHKGTSSARISPHLPAPPKKNQASEPKPDYHTQGWRFA